MLKITTTSFNIPEFELDENLFTGRWRIKRSDNRVWLFVEYYSNGKYVWIDSEDIIFVEDFIFGERRI